MESRLWSPEFQTAKQICKRITFIGIFRADRLLVLATVDELEQLQRKMQNRNFSRFATDPRG